MAKKKHIEAEIEGVQLNFPLCIKHSRKETLSRFFKGLDYPITEEIETATYFRYFGDGRYESITIKKDIYSFQFGQVNLDHGDCENMWLKVIMVKAKKTNEELSFGRQTFQIVEDEYLQAYNKMIEMYPKFLNKEIFVDERVKTPEPLMKLTKQEEELGNEITKENKQINIPF